MSNWPLGDDRSSPNWTGRTPRTSKTPWNEEKEPAAWKQALLGLGMLAVLILACYAW